MIVYPHERKKLAFKLMLLGLYFSTIIAAAIIYGVVTTILGV